MYGRGELPEEYSHTSTHRRAALFFHELGRISEAEQLLRSALAIGERTKRRNFPQDHRHAFVLLGKIRDESEQREKAEEIYEELRRSLRGEPDAWVGSAFAQRLHRSGRVKTAEAEYRRWLDYLDPVENGHQTVPAALSMTRHGAMVVSRNVRESEASCRFL